MRRSPADLGLAVALEDLHPSAGGLDLRRGVPLERISTAAGNEIRHHDRSARDATGRVIVQADGTVLRYDHTVDPKELSPLAEGLEHLESAARAVTFPVETEPTSLDEEALRALGYIE